MMSAAADSLTGPKLRVTPRWEQIGNVAVLFAYASVVLFTVRFHEKWADEAQAWLIARDLPLKQIWFSELRYEGAPGLWHTILWLAQRAFHAPYDAMSYIGVGFAIAGVALLVFKAPFPWFIRWSLAFTYFFVYQYAVIARPYTLLPLLCFSVAIFFDDIRHPIRITLVLIVLANLSLHGTILAACFGLLYLWRAIKMWPSLDENTRRDYVLCCTLMVLTFAFLYFVLKPTPDNEEFVMKHRLEQMPAFMKEKLQVVTPMRKLKTAICGALLDYLAPSLAFLVIATAWFVMRRRLGIFFLPVTTMLALYSIVHGYAHHHGTVLVALVTAIWIAWPRDEQTRALTERQVWIHRVFVAALVVCCLLNDWDATVAINREYKYPYSGAKDAADYLKSVGGDRQPMFGLLYGVAGVQAYFDHNIFANLPTTYFHHGLPLWGTFLDTDLLYKVQPEYVVVYSVEPELLMREGAQELTGRGYKLVHFSDGYYLYKRGVYQRECYFIFRRIH